MNGLLPPRGYYFDGDKPVPQQAGLAVSGGDLVITPDGGVPVRWPVGDVRRVHDGAARADAVLRLTSDPVARLIVKHADVLDRLPHLYRRTPPKGRVRLAGWAAAAIVAVAVQIGVLIPLLADNLAGYIPAAGERALGEATFDQIRDALTGSGMAPLRLCESPKGRAALDQILVKLSGKQDFRQDITVSVLDHPMVNAFALPGGFVVVFRGLIEAAKGPDEVAAVLGHEIGHVISRDPTRHALRSAGSIGVLGLLFGDFAGGAAVLFLTERLISAQYSQEAEAGADRFAYGVLGQAGISPGALGDMFENMRSKTGDSEGVTAHFLSHPTMAQRIASARAATDKDVTYAPSLTAAQWDDLRAICK